ncbi:MAG: phage tail tape measure protein, partial [Neisseria sp.]|nr:phage tail tape measure protein [Neisseria sp.]
MVNDLVLNIIMNASDKASAAFARAKAASEGLNGKLGQLKKEMLQLDEAQKQLAKRTDLQKKIKENSTALMDNAKAQHRLTEEIARAGAPTKAQAKELEKLVKEGGKLRESHDKNTKKQNEYNQKLRQAGISARFYSQAQDQLNAKHTKLTAALEKERAAHEKLERARRGLHNVPLAAGAFAGGAMYLESKARNIANGLSAPVRAYAESETSGMDLRVAMMDKSGKVAAEYEAINTLATRLGDKLPGTTADFKNLMTMLIRQGMSAKTILGGTGEAAALLAVQLKKTPEAAAEMAAKLQDATRGTEKEMLGIMDMVQRLYYAGVEDSNTLGAFSKMAPALDIVKVKGEAAMKMFGPLIGMLDQAGLSGESAGNAFRKVFSRSMDADIPKKLQKLEKSGLLPKNFSLDFTDGKGEFGGMDKMFAELQKLKALNTQQRNEIIAALYGDDAETLQVLNVMIDKGKAGYDEFIKKLENQAGLNQRVNEQLGTLSNLWDAAGGTFMNFLASMGESIAPELKSLTEWIGSVNEKLSIWAKNNPALVGGLLKIAAILGGVFAFFAAVASAASALVLPFAALKYAFTALQIGSLIGKLGGLLKIFGLLKSGIILVGRAFLMNPIGLVVTAIVVALYFLWKHWDTVKNALITGWNWLKGVFRDNPLLAAFLGPVGWIVALIANWDRF